MAASRTGTTQWKKLRAKVLRRAQAQGVMRCPYCKVPLNYKIGRTPSSAEPDHIVPYIKGGQDIEENLIVICRKCNQSKSDRQAPRLKTIVTAKPLKTSRQW